MGIREVNYGSRTIEYELKIKDVKNINLSVNPKGEIYVSANEEVKLEEIDEFVIENGRWIRKNQRYFERNRPIEKDDKEYVSGESFRYLGRQYRLKVMEAEADKVKYLRGRIILYTQDKTDFKRKKELMYGWYEERMEVVFQDSLDRMYEKISHQKIEKPRLDRRSMRNRWGTAYKDRGLIILNRDLIEAPRYCIDYVVLHELIHLIHDNHGREFIILLSILMPDWEERKRVLDEKVVREL